MAYNENLDVVLVEKEVVGNELVVRLCQYDGGQKKIAIMKRLETKNGVCYTGKIGRLDVDTAFVLAQRIAEICKENKNG